MRIYTKESLIAELIKIRNRGWIQSRRRYNNAGAVGNTLEKLLGIEENNLPIPNASEWELKARRKNTVSLLTLFHCEPSPRALKLVQWLLANYGWKLDETGVRYSALEKSFRQTLNCSAPTERGFGIEVDRINKKVKLAFSFEAISPKHNDWKQEIDSKGLSILASDYTPYWGFLDLISKAGSKLPNCFYVTAETKKENGKEFFKYSEIKMLSGFSSTKFIEMIESGRIYIDFDARTKHNHGTKFRITPNYFSELYDNVKII